LHDDSSWKNAKVVERPAITLEDLMGAENINFGEERRAGTSIG